jgi:predicted helicase
MSRMIGFYNAEVARFNRAYPGLDKKGRDASVDGFIDTNPEQISWTRNIKQELSRASFRAEVGRYCPQLVSPVHKTMALLQPHIQ